MRYSAESEITRWGGQCLAVFSATHVNAAQVIYIVALFRAVCHAPMMSAWASGGQGVGARGRQEMLQLWGGNKIKYTLFDFSGYCGHHHGRDAVAQPLPLL